MQLTSEELVKYGLQIEGQDVVSKAFRDVAKSQLESQSASQQLSAELKAAGRTQAVEARAVQRAYKEQQAAARELGAEQRQVIRALNDAGRAAQAQSMGLSKLSVFGQKAALTLGSIATAAQNANPQLAGFGAAISRASGLIGGLSSLVGGPWAVAIGVLTAGVGIAATAWKNFGDEEDTVREKGEDLNVTLQDTIDLIKKLDSARLQKQLLAGGLAGTETQFAEVRRLEATRDQIVGAQQRLANRTRYVDRKRFGWLPFAPDDGINFGTEAVDRPITQRDLKRAKDLEQRRLEVEKQIGAARANYTRSIQEDVVFGLEGEDEGGEKKRKREKREKQNAIGEPSDLQRWEMDQAGEGYYSDSRAASESSRSALDKFKRDEKAKRERTFVGREGENDALRRSVEGHVSEEEKMYKRKDALVKAHYALLTDTAHEAWMTVGASAGAAFAAMAAGQKVAFAEVLSGIGQQLVASGTGHVFEGIFQSLMLNPLGPEMVAIGTAEAAFGAGLAAAGGAANRGAGANTATGGAYGSAASPTYTSANVEDRRGETFELHIHSTEVPSQDGIVRLYRGFQQAARTGVIPRSAVGA